MFLNSELPTFVAFCIKVSRTVYYQQGSQSDDLVRYVNIFLLNIDYEKYQILKKWMTCNNNVKTHSFKHF